METQVFGAFRGRKRGAGVEQALKAPKQAPVQAPAPAAKKRRGSTQPKIQQALQRAAAAPRAAEAGGSSDGIATQLLRNEAVEHPAACADVAPAAAGGLDLERADADAAAAPATQPQEEQRPTRCAVDAPARAAPLAAGHATVDAAAGLNFEHEVRAARHAAPRFSRASHRPLPPLPAAGLSSGLCLSVHLSALPPRQALESSDEDECDDEEEHGAEPSAVRARLMAPGVGRLADRTAPAQLSELEANISLNKRIMESCDRVRLACVPGSAKALMAARHRDSFADKVVALARYLTPEGMSDDDEEADAAAADAAQR